jgi:hypothetical protein
MLPPAVAFSFEIVDRSKREAKVSCYPISPVYSEKNGLLQYSR